MVTFWCITSTVMKYKELLSVTVMSQLTAVFTVMASMPFIKKRHVKSSLVYAIAGVALSFFLFSYHVHEKTILPI